MSTRCSRLKSIAILLLLAAAPPTRGDEALEYLKAPAAHEAVEDCVQNNLCLESDFAGLVAESKSCSQKSPFGGLSRDSLKGLAEKTQTFAAKAEQVSSVILQDVNKSQAMQNLKLLIKSQNAEPKPASDTAAPTTDVKPAEPQPSPKP